MSAPPLPPRPAGAADAVLESRALSGSPSGGRAPSGESRVAADAYAEHLPLFQRLHEHVRRLPDVPQSFLGKYELMADPARGRRRMALLEYELRLAGCDPRGQVVLDAGCGTGLYSVMFAMLGAARVDAVDFFPRNVEFLTGLAREFRLPIEPRLRDVADTGLPVGSTGLVYCVEAISHFHDWKRFLDEAARVLRPGGHIVIGDGNNGANPTIRRGIHAFWLESENGPFTVDRYPPDKNLPYLFRRWMIIRRHFPGATDEEVFQLGLRTAEHGGDELIAECRRYFESGRMPPRGYRHGQSQRRPEDGQRNEEPLDPREIADYLRTRGLRARARAHFGFSRHPLLPTVNRVAGWLGTLPLRFAERYLVFATK